MTGVALDVRGLRVGYDDQVVLDGVDLSVPNAVMGAIVGPNGAGKSTLIKAVLGLVPIRSGEVRLVGRASRADGGAWGTCRSVRASTGTSPPTPSTS